MKRTNYSEEQKKQAIQWWTSLPGGKKAYLKEHQKLTCTDKIVKYWIGCVQDLSK